MLKILDLFLHRTFSNTNTAVEIKLFFRRSGGNLREYLLVEYASNLSNLDCYWQVVVDYLAYCGPQSDHYLPLFIQKIPLSSETKAAKVLRLCHKQGYTDEG